MKKAAEKRADKNRHYDSLEHDVAQEAYKAFKEPAYVKIPQYVRDVYRKLSLAAGMSGFEITGLRDRRTGKEYIKADEIQEKI